MMKRLFNWFRQSKLGSSVFRHGYPDNPKDQSQVMTAHFLTHIHPVKVKEHGLKFNYTFGLGGLSLALFIILTFTGLLLMLYYVASTERAYDDMLYLRNIASFGWLFRNMHRWAAHLMVAIVFLHLCRVFYTGSYKGSRKFNWVIGVFLFLVTILLSYTGYLLPWDQLAYWGISVGVGLTTYIPLVGKDIQELLLGATKIGQPTLTRFYVLHVVLLPAVAILLMAMHFYRIRKDGGISDPPEQDTGEEVHYGSK